MSRFRRKPKQEEPANDPKVLVVVILGAGATATAFREAGGTVTLLAEADGLSPSAAAEWAEARHAGRTVTVIGGAEAIVRAVQLPDAEDGRLEAALRLNATTFVLGRTPPWRVASSMLPGTHGEGIRTGLVVEWPEETDGAQAMADRPSGTGSFAPSIASLAALSRAAKGPLVLVDPRDPIVSLSIPTSKGLLVRTVRAGTVAGAVTAQDVSLAVGEACVHAAVPGQEIPALVGAAAAAAEPVLDGGFGCSTEDLRRIAQLVPGAPADRGWWQRHGLAAGIALAAFGPLAPLTALQEQDPGKPLDRVGAILARIAQPRTARKLLIGGLLAVLLGPMAIEGARLLLLRWKLPDLQGYLRAEDTERRRHAMYRSLARQGASMTKTLSDIASCAPDGVDIEFINVVPAAGGQSVTVRGKARAAGSMPATEVLMEMERQLRESGAFEAIQRSSDAPDSRGYQEFSLNATAVRPTYLVAYPEAQDFAKTSMRERRYGPPPEDVDAAASGIESPARKSGASVQRPDEAEGEEAPVSEAPRKVAIGPAPRPAPTSAPAATAETTAKAPDALAEAASRKEPAPLDEGAAPSPASGEATEANASPTAKEAEAEAQGKEPSDAADGASSRGTRTGARGARPGARGSLATRSNPGASAAPEPVPPPISENEIARMSPEEVRTTLAAVAKARNERTDLDDATRERLKNEWNMLLDRLRSLK